MNRFKRGLGMIVCIILTGGVLWGADSVSLISEEYGASSRTSAMGSIQGLQSESYSIFENPASLPRDSRTYYSTYFMTLADAQSSYFTASVAYPLDKKGHVALGIAQKRSPNLDFSGADQNGEYVIASQFVVADTLFKLGYQQQLTDSLSLGLSAHYFVQDLYLTQGAGWNMDAGLWYNFGRVKVSATAKNMLGFSQMSYSNGYRTLNFPSEFVTSAQFDLTDYFKIYGQLRGEKLRRSVGVYVSPIPTLAFLGGIREVGSTGVQTQYSAGVMLNLGMMALNFSYQNSQVVDYDGLYGISVDFHL